MLGGVAPRIAKHIEQLDLELRVLREPFLGLDNLDRDCPACLVVKGLGYDSKRPLCFA